MLDEVIRAIAFELRDDHEWGITEDDKPWHDDCLFAQVLRKHLAPLLPDKALIEARIAALDAERGVLMKRL